MMDVFLKGVIFIETFNTFGEGNGTSFVCFWLIKSLYKAFVAKCLKILAHKSIKSQ